VLKLYETILNVKQIQFTQKILQFVAIFYILNYRSMFSIPLVLYVLISSFTLLSMKS